MKLLASFVCRIDTFSICYPFGVFNVYIWCVCAFAAALTRRLGRLRLPWLSLTHSLSVSVNVQNVARMVCMVSDENLIWIYTFVVYVGSLLTSSLSSSSSSTSSVCTRCANLKYNTLFMNIVATK